MNEELRKVTVEKVNERNTTTMVALIEELEKKVDSLEEQLQLNHAYVNGVQTAIATLSDQVMGLLVWRATEEQNRGDDD